MLHDCIHYIYDSSFFFFTVNWELINPGQADIIFAPSVSLTRWSSSHSIFRATRWCTGLHLRDCRGASGLCSRCAHLEKTALLCHSFGRESHMNSKSAPSSTNSREQTAMSKLARRWKKVGVGGVNACGCACEFAVVLACVHACFHVYTIFCAQLSCVSAHNSCSQQAVRAGLCYV